MRLWEIPRTFSTPLEILCYLLLHLKFLEVNPQHIISTFSNFFSFISLPLLLFDYSDSYYPVLIFPGMFDIVNHFVFSWNPFLSLTVASVFASFFWNSVLKPAHPSLALSSQAPQHSIRISYEQLSLKYIYSLTDKWLYLDLKWSYTENKFLKIKW